MADATVVIKYLPSVGAKRKEFFKMKKNLFAKASTMLGVHLDRLQNKLEQMTREIDKLNAEIPTATGAKKTGMMTRLAIMQNRFNKEAKKYNTLASSQYAVNFLDRLFASFKSQWIPIVCVILLIMGPFSSVTGFVVGTLVNLVVMFALLCVVMHVQKQKYEENSELAEKPTDMVVAKVLFLAITLLKLTLSFFGPVVMMVVVVLGAIGVALYIERNDLKILIERLKEKNDRNDEHHGEDGQE